MSGNRRFKWALAMVLAGAVVALVAYPTVVRFVVGHSLAERASATARTGASHAEAWSQEPVALRVERLGGLLSSWETIGGCGAGSSAGAGASVKWIGRGTRGGLFNAQFLASYMPLPEGLHYDSGYNLSVTAQITRDVADEWNVGVLVPYLYKYYRNYFDLRYNPVDISNGGIGDVNFLVTRRFGPINATALTLSVGMPTGTFHARYKNDLLSQEKQLGLGRHTGALTLDHTMDELWGLIVVGASGGYRGGENAYKNFRAPVAGAYAYAGYYLGPFIPSFGVSYNHFFKRDRDRTLEQDMALNTVAGNVAIEWASDYVAILGGFSLPVTVPKFEVDPWLVAIGFSVSPF
jgi:hypothetical protein